MARFIAFIYGVFAYLVFGLSFLYAIGFVSGYVVPTTLNVGKAASPVAAVIFDLLVLGVFAIQHSGMARQAFKRWLTRLVTPAVERSTYVLASSLALVLIFWQWRPITAQVWQVDSPGFAELLIALSWVGWVIVVSGTFQISHFELFGLSQVTNNLLNRPAPEPELRTPLYYRFVRHPLYLGFILAFWCTPSMTAGHLLFAAVTTAYILVGIMFEERDLIAVFGEEYRRYRKRVPMLIPWRKPL